MNSPDSKKFMEPGLDNYKHNWKWNPKTLKKPHSNTTPSLRNSEKRDKSMLNNYSSSMIGKSKISKKKAETSK